MAKIDEVEAKLRVCIQRAKEHGVPITNRRWNVHWNEEERKYERDKPYYGCCAMACLLIYADEPHDQKESRFSFEESARLLGLDVGDVYVFIAGFDGMGLRTTPDKCDTDNPSAAALFRDKLYELGKKLRDEFVTQEGPRI